MFPLCVLVLSILYIAARYAFSLPPRSRGDVLPLRTDPLLRLSATALAKRLREGDITSVELIEKALRHIGHVNQAMNAVVWTRAVEAREEARQADAQLLAARRRHGHMGVSSLPPFLGVPCSIKEVFALRGQRQTSGHPSRVDSPVAEVDATVVKRLRENGFIVLCGTNVSELCMWMESYNPVYGISCNPYDYRRTTGGSSGGEGAIVSACGVPVGVGSDIGGSIRIPSFFNGIFGHKPTSRTVPNTGQYPCAYGEAGKYLTTGPMCRHAEDLFPLLRIMRGHDKAEGGDLGSFEHPEFSGTPADVDVSKLHVYVIPSLCFPGARVSADLLEAQTRAALHLSGLGCSVQYLHLDRPDTVPKGWGPLKAAFDIWGSMMTQNPVSFESLMAEGRSLYPTWELLKWFVGKSSHTLPALGLCLLEKTYTWMPGRHASHIKLGAQVKEDVKRELGDNGIILMPPYTTVAPHHYRALLYPVQWQYTALWNALEFPVTQVPMGLNAQGIPTGVQVIANHHRDHVSIAVALALEKAFGGHYPPERLCS